MKNINFNYLPTVVLFCAIWLLFVPVSHSQGASVIKTAILFLAYDQGEVNAFKHIQDKLTQANIPYRILAMGRAAEAFKEHPNLIKMSQLTHNESILGNRNHPLNQNLVYNLSDTISAKIIYSGMSSRAQAQLANAWHMQGAKVIAFYDNFEPIDSIAYVQPFLKELRYIDEFHVPSVRTADSFQEIAIQLDAKVMVTGQPVLENWDKIYQETNPFQLRDTLNIHPSQPVALFAGDYSKGYLKAFTTFIEATTMLPNILFLVTHHPKFDGSLEREIIESQSIGNVQLIEYGTYSTAALSTIASVVIVHKSSVAQQAIYKGKPVIYVADHNYHNLMLTEHLAIRASTVKPLAIMIKAHVMGYSPPAVADKLGIPSTASDTISELLINDLNKP